MAESKFPPKIVSPQASFLNELRERSIEQIEDGAIADVIAQRELGLPVRDEDGCRIMQKRHGFSSHISRKDIIER